ncbi:hypothetical protein RHSIM_RhsimUnG0242900 [Rhododendron simsii]|uniref:Uncharacterized protein n=1 Tax=Rhododendron simsii TaxID=118357 RepID=A0A834FTB8_RHOSS|nr:hypothetical protein RHSIM_RhsimUnG0242900 [Rhododendron simsii]
MNPQHSMPEHLRVMSAMIRDLRAAGNVLTDEQQILAMLRSLPDKTWDHFKLTMTHNEMVKTFNDLKCHLELEAERQDAMRGNETPSFQKTVHCTARPLSITSNSLSPEPDPLPPAVQTFWKWVSGEGLISSKKCPVKPAIVPEGLGLVAQRDIGRNEVVLEVPKKFWINPDTVSASEIGSVCGGLKPWISVALFLIREKKLGEESMWRSEEELSEIQG